VIEARLLPYFPLHRREEPYDTFTADRDGHTTWSGRTLLLHL